MSIPTPIDLPSVSKLLRYSLTTRAPQSVCVAIIRLSQEEYGALVMPRHTSNSDRQKRPHLEDESAPRWPFTNDRRADPRVVFSGRVRRQPATCFLGRRDQIVKFSCLW